MFHVTRSITHVTAAENSQILCPHHDMESYLDRGPVGGPRSSIVLCFEERAAPASGGDVRGRGALLPNLSLRSCWRPAMNSAIQVMGYSGLDSLNFYETK